MFTFGEIMTTHLEDLERGLELVMRKNHGVDSLYAQDLRAQIAAAKWTLDQQKLSPSQLEETYFGGTRNSAPNEPPETRAEYPNGVTPEEELKDGAMRMARFKHQNAQFRKKPAE